MADAAEYEVLVRASAKTSWREHTRCGEKANAIEVARRRLALGGCVAATVQGRGTPDWPTPPGEVVVYRGVAAGYSARAFFAGAYDVAPAGVESVERDGAVNWRTAEGGTLERVDG